MESLAGRAQAAAAAEQFSASRPVCVRRGAAVSALWCYLKVSGVHWNALEWQALPNMHRHTVQTHKPLAGGRERKGAPADQRTVAAS